MEYHGEQWGIMLSNTEISAISGMLCQQDYTLGNYALHIMWLIDDQSSFQFL